MFRLEQVNFLLGRYFQESNKNAPEVDRKRGDNEDNVESNITHDPVETNESHEGVITKALKTLAIYKTQRLQRLSMVTLGGYFSRCQCWCWCGASAVPGVIIQKTSA